MFNFGWNRESRRIVGFTLALCACVAAGLNISSVGGEFSNGLFEMIDPESQALCDVGGDRGCGTAFDADPRANPFDVSSGILPTEVLPVNSFERDVLPAPDAFLSPIAPLDFTADFADDFTDEDVLSQGSVEFTGSGLVATSSPVIRGSVNLPPLKAIQFWGAAYSGSGRVKPVGYEKKISRNNTGASVGVNIPLGLATLSGFYNYHRDREFLPTSRIEQTDGSYGATVYLNMDGFYFAASGFYGSDKYRGRAAVGTGENASIVKATYDGSQCAGFFETGYEMMGMGMFVLKPFASYCYSNVRHDRFDPTTLQSAPGKKKYNSCRMTLGSRVDFNLAGLDFFTLQGRMAWITELRSKTESFSSFNYGRIPGDFSPASPYYFGNGAGSDYFWGGVGMRLSAFGMLSVSIDYDCYFNKRQTLHEGGLGLLFGF